MKDIKTNLRWAGGKSKMTKIPDKFLPENINKYLEVFTGGGSVLLYITQKYNPQIVYANDIDDKLINYYKSIGDNYQSIINECLEIKNNNNIDDYFIYLDPPYFDNKNKGLYGKKGNLHKKFNHIDLFNWVKNHSSNNKIMLSYDDSPYIKDLYKDFNIYGFDFIYSMTNVGGKSCKSGKEIVITNY